MENGYRFTVGAIVAVLFAVQHTVMSRLSGHERTIAGYGLTIGFLVAVAEFATLTFWRWISYRSTTPVPEGRVPVRSLVVLVSLILLLDLFSKVLSPYLALQRRPPPTIPLLIVVAWWVAAILVMLRRREAAYHWSLIGIAGLVLGTRVLVLWVCRFDRLTGDMLPTIDRSLDELLAGRFPYVNFPPPMPYLPGTFLAYLPPKILGLDLRLSNLVLDLIAAIAVMRFALDFRKRPFDPVGGTPPRLGLSAGQVALPLFMLHPSWIFYSVNTQFSPSLLATALLGLAVRSATPRWQAVSLGFAIGSNQMLVATGPILFGFWLSQYGCRRAFGLAALAIGVFLALIAPFLLWNPRQFILVAFLSRGAFPPELMSGRFTIAPLFSGLIPHASLILTGFGIGLGTIFAMRARQPESTVAAMALALCFALLAQSVSFSHYFLPVLTLAAIAVGRGSERGTF